jgi:ribose transport system permease protein
MSAAVVQAGPARVGELRRLAVIRNAPAAVTALAMLVIFVICVSLQPALLSVNGLSLVLSSIVPLVLAAVAQMVMMSVGDIDLSIGAFVGLVTAISATLLTETPVVGVLALLALVVAYGLLGALVHLRKVPSLIATLGASFIWLGLGTFALPTPGGSAPDWLFSYAAWNPTWFPAPLVPIIVVSGLAWLVTQGSALGVELRALGSNPVALQRSGAREVLTRVTAYALVAVLGILAGLTLTSQIGGGDVSAADSYTLISVAAVILGGGSFRGGRSVPWGAMVGAVTLGLVSVLLSFLNLSSNVQPAIQGGIVIAALAGRLVVERVIR